MKGCLDAGIMFARQTAPSRFTVQSDSGWAGDRSTRKSVSAGSFPYGQHVLRSWSKDQTVIAMSSGEAEVYAACMAALQAMGTESMAPDSGVHLAPWNCKWTPVRPLESSAGRDLENGGTWTSSYLWLQSALRGRQVDLKKVQSESNMAGLGAKAPEQDKIDRHMKNLECVRFDQ